MPSRILVPLDGSALAERALPCAVMLARGVPAELVLFRAVSIAPDLEAMLGFTDLGGEVPWEELEVQACDYLNQVADRIQEAGLGIDKVVRRGPAAEVIVDYAEQMAVQQIVMATHGRSGISRWRHGIAAERVLQSASVPVLMVCAKAGESVSEEPMTCQAKIRYRASPAPLLLSARPLRSGLRTGRSIRTAAASASSAPILPRIQSPPPTNTAATTTTVMMTPVRIFTRSPFNQIFVPEPCGRSPVLHRTPSLR